MVRIRLQRVGAKNQPSYRVIVVDSRAPRDTAYIDRIGHYNPRGNHFFAYAIKDHVVQWLDPKPITYRKLDPASVDFKGYLPDARR